MTEAKINYIEVSVFDGHKEITGLLTHYGISSGRVRLLTDSLLTSELFTLSYYSITRIIVSKSSATTDKEEQYIFKNSEEDQNMAKSVILNNLRELEAEGRTTVSGFITRDTFTNLPEKYGKEPENKSTISTVNTQKDAPGGTEKPENKTITTGTTTLYTQQTTYTKKNVKTIIFVPRTSKLPSKAALKKMKAMVKAVSADTFVQNLPDLDSDIGRPPSRIEMEEDLTTGICYDSRNQENGYHNVYDG